MGPTGRESTGDARRHSHDAAHAALRRRHAVPHAIALRALVVQGPGELPRRCADDLVARRDGSALRLGLAAPRGDARLHELPRAARPWRAAVLRLPGDSALRPLHAVAPASGGGATLR